ncbi:hypothetical protein DOM21_17430 [Bacteriovorax stolpii]|nr:hypothetical protein DOM21_17430 [Bacteriovorax stolpii]
MGQREQLFEVTMAIYKLKSKKWKAEFWYKGQRLCSKTFSNKALADKWERDLDTEYENKSLTGSIAQDYTYNEIYEYWLSNAVPRKTSRSLVKDKQMYRDYIEPFIGRKKISEISAILLSQIPLKALNKGLSKSSANKIIQHFKAVFNEAYLNDLICRNPAKNIKQYKLEKKEMVYFSQEEMDQILTLTNLKYTGNQRWIHIVYLTCFSCGCRIGEVLGLEWHKINFERNIINISQQWDSVNHTLSNTTKGKKDRIVPLPTSLKIELGALKNFSQGSFIFSNSGERPIDASNFRNRHWSKDLEAAGISKKRIHDTRHTYASHFMMNGGNLYDLKAILGHADFKTTENYAHFSKEHLVRSKDIIQFNIQEPNNVIATDRFVSKNESRQIHASERNVIENAGVSY